MIEDNILEQLCYAWVTNGELLPRKGTKEGKRLSDILRMLKGTDYRSSVELINNQLMQYGTNIETLAENSGLRLKRERKGKGENHE